MARTLSGAGVVAAATFSDLRRRPGVLLAALAVGALLAYLPEVCSRAVDESYALALQVGLATISTFLLLVAGFSGLRAGAATGDLGAAAEWRASPLSPPAYLVGRFAGIVAAAAALFVPLALLLVVAERSELRDVPPDAAVAGFAVFGALLAAAQFAALGLLLATLFTPQLAATTLVAAIVASRTLVPALAARGPIASAIASILPDPARLELSRELAFHRTVDAAAASLACVASTAQIAACLVFAAWRLPRRAA